MAGHTGEPTDLEMTAGLPYGIRFTVPGRAAVWPTRESFEIRSDIRVGKTEATPLAGRLVDYITAVVEGPDIIVTVRLSGAQTRVVAKGYYDIVLSDPGVEDERALCIAHGKVKVDYLRTAAANEVVV